LAPAGYYRSTESYEKLEEYKNKSTFLNTLNNEVGQGSQLFEDQKAKFM